MQFIIYEDDIKSYEKIKDMLIRFSIKLNIEFNIFHIQNKDSLSKHSLDNEFTIFILDIVNDSCDGISLSKLIQEKIVEPNIIFISSFLDFMYDSLNSNVRPIAYVYKNDEKFEKLLFQAIKSVLTANKKIIINFKDQNGDLLSINMHDVHFITPSKRQKYIDIYTSNSVYTVKGKLLDFCEICDFIVQTSRFTLVNKFKIKKIKNTSYRHKIIDTGLTDKDLTNKCILTKKYKDKLY